jgi:hypothetical protein
MNVLLNEIIFSSIEEKIQESPAWIGRVSGLRAEKLLEGNTTPYLYVIRAGEYESDYYVTFVLPDLSIKHQPFIITSNHEGWSYEQGSAGGPYSGEGDVETIDHVIHEIMHCNKDDCMPFTSDLGSNPYTRK